MGRQRRKEGGNMVTATIWGGPLWRDAFQEHDVVFIESLNRQGTIVSGELHPGTYGLEKAVYVEFQSGEGLPDNDRVQVVPTSQLKKAG
jgi:hypothetical protein